MSTPSTDSAKSPLEAAQRIVTELQGMSAENQFLAMKFASETLGLKSPSGSPSSAASPFHAPPLLQPNATSGADNWIDIRSFAATKAPKSDQQFCAVVAYFYQFEAKPNEKKTEIDAEVMKEAARLAGRPQVERWGMTLNNAKNAGYLDATGSGTFKLSSVGENLVAITLPNNDGSGNSKITKRVKGNYKQRVIKKKKR